MLAQQGIQVPEIWALSYLMLANHYQIVARTPNMWFDVWSNSCNWLSAEKVRNNHYFMKFWWLCFLKICRKQEMLILHKLDLSSQLIWLLHCMKIPNSSVSNQIPSLKIYISHQSRCIHFFYWSYMYNSCLPVCRPQTEPKNQRRFPMIDQEESHSE